MYRVVQPTPPTLRSRLPLPLNYERSYTPANGQIGLTARWPWVVAFSFGLLHGFGFASALADIGLPQGDIPLALFAFNVGVECGQLAFVAAVLSVAALARRVGPGLHVERYVLRMAPYAIGSLAAFWLFERLARF